MLDLIGLVFEVIATIVVETVAWFAKMLFWPSRRPEVPAAAAPRELPEGVAPRIVAALKAGEDAAALLPGGWRGFHSSVLDPPSSEVADETPVGAEPRLVFESDRVLVEPVDRSTVRIGYLTNQELERSIKLGRVRCWLAGRKHTLTNPSAAVLFVAVYDP